MSDFCVKTKSQREGIHTGDGPRRRGTTAEGGGESEAGLVWPVG
jgi:hypothetical protein